MHQRRMLTDSKEAGLLCPSHLNAGGQNQITLASINLPLLLIPCFDHYHHSSYKKEHEMDNNNRFGISNYYDPKDIWRGLDYEQRHHNTRSFYSLFEGKVVSDFQLPVPSYMNCRGSGHGWLALVQECRDGTTTYPVHLFNPFRSDQKGNKIHLPPLNLTNSYFLIKVIFSGDPSVLMSSSLIISNPTTNDDHNDKLLVLGLSYGALMFCRPGDEAWTQLPAPSHSAVFDVIFYKGRFWGILQIGSVVVFDLTPEPKLTIVVEPHPDDGLSPSSRYLVESSGDLFNVARVIVYDDVGYSTVRFQVFKLNPTTMQWVKTTTLDGSMFFLGDNASMSCVVEDYFPAWCKPNSIYFIDEHFESHCATPWIGPHDIGVFNLESGSCEPLYTMDSKPIMPEPPIMPTPIWIQPKP